MAGLRYRCVASAISVTGSGGVKSAWQIKAPTNQKILIREIRISGGSAAGGTDTPCKIRGTRNTASFGTFTGGTPAKVDALDSETIQGTFGFNASVEPTTPTDAGYYTVLNPQLPLIDYRPYDQPIIVPGGYSYQFEITNPNTGAEVFTIDCLCEE